MNTEADKQAVLDLLRSTSGSGLTANQRLILMVYSMLATERSGVVRKTGAELAKLLDLDPTVFSRLRRGLIKEGWLEESGPPLGNIRYYRLSEKSTGEQVVIPLRRAT